jgi:hypothetical protein
MLLSVEQRLKDQLKQTKMVYRNKHVIIYNIYIVRCCIYLRTYDWIKSFLKITIDTEPYMEI